MEQRMFATEQALGNTRAAVDEMQAQMTQHMTNQNLAEAAHQQLHAEVVELRQLRTEVERLQSRGPGTSNPDKSLLPGPYAMDKTKWPSWSLRFRRFMNRKHPGLGAELLKVEGKSSPLTPEYLRSTGIGDEVSEDLLDYLTANTEAEAGLIIRGSQEEHGLEGWRRIAYASEPKGSFSELRDARLATRPSRCTKPSELASHFAAFENKLLKLTNRTGSCPLTLEGKRWAILDMVPATMEKELEAQIHLFKTYEDLKAHSLDLAARKGYTGETHNLEEEAIEYVNESGELCRLEKQSGKWIAANRKPKTNPKPAAKQKFPDGSCFRCGKIRIV